MALFYFCAKQGSGIWCVFSAQNFVCVVIVADDFGSGESPNVHVEWYHLGLGATGCRPQCILELFLQLLFLQILLMCNLMYIHPALDSSNSRFKVGHCPGTSEKVGLQLIFWRCVTLRARASIVSNSSVRLENVLEQARRAIYSCLCVNLQRPVLLQTYVFLRGV